MSTEPLLDPTVLTIPVAHQRHLENTGALVSPPTSSPHRHLTVPTWRNSPTSPTLQNGSTKSSPPHSTPVFATLPPQPWANRDPPSVAQCTPLPTESTPPVPPLPTNTAEPWRPALFGLTNIQTRACPARSSGPAGLFEGSSRVLFGQSHTLPAPIPRPPSEPRALPQKSPQGVICPCRFEGRGRRAARTSTAQRVGAPTQFKPAVGHDPLEKHPARWRGHGSTMTLQDSMR